MGLEAISANPLTRMSRVVKEGFITLPNRNTKVHVGRGLKRLRTEDYLMCLAFCFYTADIVTMNITAELQSNLLPPGYLKTHTISPQEEKARHFGSIMTMVVEQCQISTVWLTKLCVLMMWYNLTNMVLAKRQRVVYFIGFYVGITWLIMEILYFGVWCRPFYEYFAVPTSNPKQCAAAWNHLITNAVFNLSSDLMLLTVSLSIVTEKVSFKLKVAFACLCSLGIFVIICACLNKSYSWLHPFGSQWTFWYIRECSTAILLANLPYIWQVIVKLIALHRRFSRGHSSEQSMTGTGSRTLTKSLTLDGQEMSRLPSTGYNSSRGPSSGRLPLKHGSTDTKVMLDTYDLAAAQKQANKGRQASLQEVDRWMYDDRSKKLPSIYSMELTEKDSIDNLGPPQQSMSDDNRRSTSFAMSRQELLETFEPIRSSGVNRSESFDPDGMHLSDVSGFGLKR